MRLLATLLVALFALMACSPKQAEQKPNEAIYILFENSGTVPQEEQDHAVNTLMNLLQSFVPMADRRETRDIIINMMFSKYSNRISWPGNASALAEQADRIKGMITFDSSFNDLVMAYDQIETSMKIMRIDSAKLYAIGPFVHVPFQEANGPIEVEVPQALSEELALSRLLPKLSVAKFYNVHPDQDEKVMEYLDAHGLNDGSLGDLDFALMGSAVTAGNLTNLL